MGRLFPLMILICAGCGGTPVVRTQQPASDRVAIKPLPPPGTFYTEGLPKYADQNRLEPTALERRLARTLRRTITPPAAIDCLAREYAARFAADQVSPPPSVVAALGHHCGYWSLPQLPYSVTAESVEALEANLRKLPDTLLQGVIGIGAVGHPDGKITAVVLVPPGHVRLEPVARSGPLRISGRLEVGDGRGEFWVQNAPGKRAIQIRVPVTPTGRFKYEAPDSTGAYRVEITRTRGKFRQTIALLHRGVNRPLKYAAPPKITPEEAVAAFTPQAVLAQINAIRKENERPGFILEPHLNSPLSDWLLRTSKSGNVTGLPQGILDLRGWPYPRLEYGFSSGQSAESAIRLLVDSPTGHRLVNLAGDDRLGIGIMAFQETAGADVVLVALQRFETKDPDTNRQIILTKVNEARRSGGFKPMTTGARINAAAQAAAEAVIAGHLQWKHALQTVMKTVQAKRLAGGQYGVGGLTVIRPGEANFAQESSIMNPSMGHIGIGVAGGPLPGSGTPRHVIIYVVCEGPPDGA